MTRTHPQSASRKPGSARRPPVARWLQALACLAAVVALLTVLCVLRPPQRTQFWDAVFDTGHVLVFGLVALSASGFAAVTFPRAAPGWQYATGVVAALMLGCLVEVWQLWLPGRSFEFVDLANDLVGALAFPVLHAAWAPRQPLTGPHALRQRFVVLGALALLTASLVPLGLVSRDYRTRNLRFPVLLDFSGGWFERFVHAQASTLRTVPPPGGWPPLAAPRRVARIDCRPGPYPGLMLFDPYSDWRGYRVLELDLLLPDPRPVPFVLRVHDRMHDHSFQDRFNRQYLLPPGFQTVRVPLAEIRRGPLTRNLDMAAIAGLILFIPGAASPVTFYVGEIRLR
jgi:VanZ family protein